MNDDQLSTLTRLWHNVDTGLPPITHLLRHGHVATRRRRRTAASALAVCVVLAGIGWVAFDTRAGGDSATDPSAASSAGTRRAAGWSETGRITGAGTAAALRYAVTQVEDGAAAAFTGQDPNPGRDNVGANGQLQWVEAGAPGVSVVSITVQTGSDVAYDVTPCVAMGFDPIPRCHWFTSADGSVTQTYEQRQRYGDQIGIRRFAEVKRPDGTYVTVSSTNGFQVGGRVVDWNVTRPQPALTAAQLVEIASEPWWGAELPVRFLDEGERLPGYVEIAPFGS